MKLDQDEQDYLYEDTKEEMEYKKVAHFVKYYRKTILNKVNDKFMNTLLTKEPLAVILFLREQDMQLLNDFKRVVYGNIKEREIQFAYHVLKESKAGDYVGQHLQHKLGIRKTDLPTLRALKIDSKGVCTKY
jgi:hypothetical protein